MVEIPHTLQQFIGRHVHSLDALEIVLLLRQRPQMEWETGAIAGALKLDIGLVASRLEELRASGLLTGRAAKGQRFYRIDSSNCDHATALAELGKWYASHRVKIITLIFTQPVEKIQTFADAFRFRREEDET